MCFSLLFIYTLTEANRKADDPLKKNSNIGIDGMNFELTLNIDNSNIPLIERNLLNEEGIIYASVKIQYNKIYLYCNLPKRIRRDNVLPFSYIDMKHLAEAKKSIIADLQSVVDSYNLDCDVKESIVKKIECNITIKVNKDTTCGQVMNMFNRFYHKGRNIVYQDPSIECKFLKDDVTVLPIVGREKYYTVKIYNKSIEQMNKGNIEVESDLLRFELIAVNRTLKKICFKDLSIDNVLSIEILSAVIEEFKEIMNNRILKDIRTCLNELTEIIFQSLIITNSPLKTIAINKELIVDVEILEKAMIMWYRKKGSSFDRAKNNTSKFISENKQLNLPRGVIATIRKLKKYV